MSREVNNLADKFGEVQRRLAELGAKAEALRAKLIATGQSTVAGEAFVVTIRRTAIRELDPDRIKKRISEDQLQRCLVEIEYTFVTVHARDCDE